MEIKKKKQKQTNQKKTTTKFCLRNAKQISELLVELEFCFALPA